MRRFEKIAEEKKQHKKEQELRFSVEDKPEIYINPNSESKPLKKT
jgi:hypothetical protein